VAVIAVLAGGRVNEAPDDEVRLVARLAGGDRAAIDRLYARYGRGLFAYVSDLVGDAETAEEVVQDTFVAAWRGAARFERRSSVSSWLFGIARRQARDRMRSRRPDPAPEEELQLLATPEGGPKSRPSRRRHGPSWQPRSTVCRLIIESRSCSRSPTR
jgi:RNA polymerase sigma factor (sigma-70 family)